METLVRNIQRDVDKMIINEYVTVDYKKDILPLLYPIIEEIDSNPGYYDAPNSGFDVFIEALTLHLYNTYSQKKEIKITILYQAMILVKHPFLLNLLICHKTFDEYLKYREELLDALEKIFGDIPAVLPLKKILTSELKLKDKSAIQRFNFFMGFHFKNETYGKIFKDITLEHYDKIVSINSSFGLDIDETIIYTGVNRSSKSLLLTEQFIEEAAAFKTLPIVESKKWFSLYKKTPQKYEKVKSFEDDETVTILLNYNTSEKLENSYVTVVYLDENIKYKTVKKMFKNSFPVNIPLNIIDMYLEYDFYKYVSQNTLSKIEFSDTFTKLQKIAIDAYAEAKNTKDLRDIVLNHPYIRNILPNNLDYNIFSLYLRGLSKFKVYDKIPIIEFVTSYLSSKNIF